MGRRNGWMLFQMRNTERQDESPVKGMRAISLVWETHVIKMDRG